MRKGMKRFMSMGLGAVMALTGTGASAMCVQAADDPVEISIAYWDADAAFVGDGHLQEVCQMYLQEISEIARLLQIGQIRV